MSGQFTTGARVCGRTALRERKARTLVRFTLADARVMCGLDASGAAHFDPCPACDHSGLTFVVSGSAGRPVRLTAAPAVAHRAVCSACGFDGDAVLFVQIAQHHTHMAHALDQIDRWLAEHRRDR